MAQSNTQPLSCFIEAKGLKISKAAAMTNRASGSALDFFFSLGSVFVLMVIILAYKNKLTISDYKKGRG